MAVGWQFVIVALLASLVGLAELITRFRSDPAYMLRHSVAAWVYIVLNGAAGIAALGLIRAFGWFANSPHSELWRVLIASFGAIAFFRSSLFIAKIGTTDVPVGPSLMLGALLDACDREVDRRSAEEISKCVASKHMDGLDPNQVTFALPVLCLALMQNFPPGDQAQLGAELSNIRADTSLAPQVQMRAVVIQLSKYLGADLVEGVLTTTRSILVPQAPPAPVISSQVLIQETKRQLAEQTPQK